MEGRKRHGEEKEKLNKKKKKFPLGRGGAMKIQDVYEVWAWSMLWWFIAFCLFVGGVAVARVYAVMFGPVLAMSVMGVLSVMAALCVVGCSFHLWVRWQVIKHVVAVENYGRNINESATIAFRMDENLTDPEAYQFIHRLVEDRRLIVEIEKMLLTSKYPIIVRPEAWGFVTVVTFLGKSKGGKRLFSGLARLLRGIPNRRWCEVEWDRDVMVSLRNVRHELGHVAINAINRISHQDQHWILEQARIL